MSASSSKYLILSFGWLSALAFLCLVGVTTVLSQELRQKPYIVEISGSCYPEELSIEYFIAGSFGGYSSFVKTDQRFWLYEIPGMRDGRPARSMKVMIRGARCRTMVFDLPELEPGGRVLKARLRRTRPIEFRGRVNNPGALSPDDHRLTVEYWADWKCEFLGFADCMIGPNRIDSTEVRSDGRFRVRLPDMAYDRAIQPFNTKGTFEFFVRDKRTGEIVYNLRPASAFAAPRSIPVAASYPAVTEFTLEPVERAQEK